MEIHHKANSFLSLYTANK